MQKTLSVLKKALELGQKRGGQVVLLLGSEALLESGRPEIDEYIAQTLRDFGHDPTSLDRQEKYNAFYDILDNRPKSERNLILSRLLEQLSPSDGYFLLADLVKRGYFSLILTTGIDNQLEASFVEHQLQPGHDYSVYVVTEERSGFWRFLHSSVSRAKLVKLRGDWGQGIILTQLPARTKENLRRVSEAPLLIVGYGNRDRDVIAALDERSEESVWWVSSGHLTWECNEDRCVLKLLMNRESDQNVLEGEDARFDHFFRSLYKMLTQEEFPVRDEIGSWSYLVDLGQRQSSRYLEAAKGEGTGKYIPSLYCPRDALEREVSLFLESGKTGMIILGDAGRGKTNLLCHLAERLSEQDHAVFLYNCGSLAQLDVDQEIAKDLFLPEEGAFAKHIERISQKADDAGKYLIVLFDAINEFQYEGASRAGDLLQRINSLVGRCSYPRIKVIVTCRMPTWERLDIIGYTNLDWGRYYTSQGNEKTFSLEEFTSEEFEQVYPLYCERFDLKSAISSLSTTTVQRCKDPLLLRLTASAYSGDKIPFDAPSLSVFKEYYERIARRSDRRFLEQLAVEMWKTETTTIAYDHIAEHDKLCGEVKEGQDCAYERLKDLGFLIQIERGLFTSVQFTYERVFEYVLAQHMIKETQGCISAEFIEELLGRVWKFTPLWGIVQFILLYLKNQELLTELAASEKFVTREVVIETLVTLFRDNSSETTSWLTSLLEEKPFNAKRTALKAAYLIGRSAQKVFLDGAASSDESTRRTVTDLLQIISREDVDFVLDTWRELAALLTPVKLLQSPFRLLSALEITLKVATSYFYDESVMREVSDICYDSSVTSGLLVITGSKGENVISTALRRGVDEVMQRVLYKVFMSRVFKVIVFDEYMSFDQIWDSPKHREPIVEIASFYDIQAEGFEDKLPTIYEMLNSSTIMYGVAAMAVLTTRTLACPEFLLDKVEEMFSRSSGVGRMWILGGYVLAAFLPMPENCLRTLEEFTKRFILETPDVFLKDPWNVFDTLDFPLLPLGLACCKEGKDLSLFGDLMQTFISSGQKDLSNRIVEALGPVGIYYPKEVLQLLEENLNINDQDHRESLVHALAMVKTSYLDEADRFLTRHAVDDSFKYEVQIRMDIDRNRRYYDYLGTYSTVSYLFLHPEFPLSQWLALQLETLATTDYSAEQIIKTITKEAIAFFRDHDWQVGKMLTPGPWTDHNC